MASQLDPSQQFALVTASDTLILQYQGNNATCRGIAIGTAGDLAIKDDDGTTVIIPANSLAIGIIHPLATNQVLSTGTTASEIVAYF